MQEKQRFLTDVLHEVMLLDGLASSHPVSQEVLRATDIDRVFDWIAYKKVGIDKTHVPIGYFTRCVTFFSSSWLIEIDCELENIELLGLCHFIMS